MMKFNSQTKKKLKQIGEQSNLNKISRENLILRKSVQEMRKNYTFMRKLGEGTYGEVFEIEHQRLKVRRALKIVKKYTKASGSSYDQLEIMVKMDHPNILKIIQYYQGPEKWYFVMEYFEGMDLFDFIKEQDFVSEKLAAKILNEILKGLAYTHAQNVAHRDIKAQNIMIKVKGEQCIVKIIDWGLASLKAGDSMSRICGTPQYCAPQVMKGQYNVGCDMWSLGVLTYIMLSGYYPFEGKDREETLKNVRKADISFKHSSWKDVSIDAKKFIKKLMTKDTTKRLEATGAMKDGWILTNLQMQQKQEQCLKETLLRIKELSTQSKFHVVVMNFVLNFLEIPLEQQKIKREFQQIDQNNDGQLSFDQLVKAYQKIYGPEGEMLAESVFTKIDLDGSGKISFSEFFTFAANIQQNFSEQQLRQSFKLFDKDKDGTIERKQINNIICYEVNSKKYSKELQDVMCQIDLNNDGKIDIEEFICHVNKAVEKVKSRTESSLKELNRKLSQKDREKSQKEEDGDKKSLLGLEDSVGKKLG